MRNDSHMIKVAVLLIVVILLCMACMDEEAHQLVCILAATAVGCVYMACESRIVYTSELWKMLKSETSEKTKPPDGKTE